MMRMLMFICVIGVANAVSIGRYRRGGDNWYGGQWNEEENGNWWGNNWEMENNWNGDNSNWRRGNNWYGNNKNWMRGNNWYGKDNNWNRGSNWNNMWNGYGENYKNGAYEREYDQERNNYQNYENKYYRDKRSGGDGGYKKK
ncbi:bifunctional endo-1,4-beta-xylanase XylA-like isoform X2 [Dreissena polymorpha]|uniref:Uncharacterized protein n=1 Tax=Dreissena polymorpha TaxID=45954 RepID=A0A9D4EQY5_DREPO|nr:bifunctional endo-1,4-beta-xylanase XylA-like isoform X2 [Dreissena polymorpha]KAH3782891.1 hypothetical protein DPMN_160813 [Dreissena polymorpha]